MDQMKKISILDDQCYVELLDVKGDDAWIIEASRVSTGKATELTDDQKRYSLWFMMRNGFLHSSPFEQSVIWFKIKMPIFIARQINRHRTARILEKSGRYTEMDDEMYVPTMESLLDRGVIDKNESEDIQMARCSKIEKHIHESNYKSYDEYKYLKDECDVSKEVSRGVLPINTLTEEIFQMDLHNLFHLIQLRDSKHAQYEAQQVAATMLELIKPYFPISCEIFEDEIMNGVHLSASELACLKLDEQKLQELPDYKIKNLRNKLG